MASPENPQVLVEVAVDSVAGARVAVAAGASRLELCTALLEGGLTPTRGLLTAVRAAVSVPIFVMIRPRGGDFLYDADEFDVMLRDLADLRAAGASGIVTGVLTTDGAIDRERLAGLRAAAGSLPITCHRAFDLCVDPLAALEDLIALGVARVLTSGQAVSAVAGAEVIARLVAAAAGRIVVMAGAGVRPDNARDLVRRTGCRELHLSATTWCDSAMRFRRPGVPMGITPPPGEFTLRTTDRTAIASIVADVW